MKPDTKSSLHSLLFLAPVWGSGCNSARRERLGIRAMSMAIAASLFWLCALPANSINGAQRNHANRNMIRESMHSIQTAEPCINASPSPTPTPEAVVATADDLRTAGQKVKLYYLREASKIATVLGLVSKQKDSLIKDLVITNATEDELILYGPRKQRDHAYQIIATLDLPRPGINMEMWGVQISSTKPDKMAELMPKVRNQINRTQEAVRETYNELQRLTRREIRDSQLDPQFQSASQLDREFQNVLVNCLGYKSALDSGRPLSIADILLRMIAAEQAGTAAASIANGLDSWLRNSKYKDYVASMTAAGSSLDTEQRRPFERFFRARGLQYTANGWADTKGEVQQGAEQGRKALLDFALNYGRLVHQPQSFSAYSLQQSAETLNSRLQAATDALSLDMQELFVAPTLARIGAIVGRSKDFEYAQVGKVSVASLSGVSTSVTSYSVNAFDVTPPLRLTELLDKAKKVSDSTTPFVPKPADNIVGAMPLSQVIGLIGAFGEERSVWRELKSGVSLTIMPNVLRNMTSAELQVVLKTGDPQAGTREAGVKPLSRVSQHDVGTSIYVNALDFFDLSAFASQSTLNGGRGYVPILGTVWQGIFGDVPVFGTLFSWRKSPKTVYSESLVLTNSFITPTAMGIALLYPTVLTDENDKVVVFTDNVFERQRLAVSTYKARFQRR